MKCRKCRYSLWKQPPAAAGAPRVCTECGEAYRIADFEFRRGVVRFACPDCGTGYYGTTDSGHLDPPVFKCVGCGRGLEMEECVVEPDGPWSGPDDDARYMLTADLPWREGSASLRSWWRTVRVAFRNPGVIPVSLPGQPRIGKASAFLAIIGWAGALLGTLLAVVFALFLFGTQPTGVTMIGMVLGALLLQFALAPCFLAVQVFLGTAGAWIGAGPDRAAFSRYIEVGCYASVGMLLTNIPLAGGLVGPIVVMVQSIIAFSRMAPAERSGLSTLLCVVGSIVGLIAGCGGGAIVGMFLGV